MKRQSSCPDILRKTWTSYHPSSVKIHLPYQRIQNLRHSSLLCMKVRLGSPLLGLSVPLVTTSTWVSEVPETSYSYLSRRRQRHTTSQVKFTMDEVLSNGECLRLISHRSIFWSTDFLECHTNRLKESYLYLIHLKVKKESKSNFTCSICHQGKICFGRHRIEVEFTSNF